MGFQIWRLTKTRWGWWHISAPSSSPGWYKYCTFTKEGNFFSFSWTGLKNGVEGLEETAFSLMAAADFLPLNLVTSLFREEITKGNWTTHKVDLCPITSLISMVYWWLKSHTARVRLKPSTIAAVCWCKSSKRFSHCSFLWGQQFSFFEMAGHINHCQGITVSLLTSPPA